MKVETQMIVKRFFFALLVLILLTLSLALPVFAHSGKTDSKGGHYDHSTGEYHYHHGYPEHQHKNGVCPYEQRKKVDNTVEIVIAVVVGIPIAFFLLYGLVISPLSDKYKKS